MSRVRHFRLGSLRYFELVAAIERFLRVIGSALVGAYDARERSMLVPVQEVVMS